MHPEDADEAVTCIACGSSVARSDAREYDKLGDRWDRTDKRFEYICKPCYQNLEMQPRDGLEAQLERAGAGTVSDDEFLGRFLDETEVPDSGPE